MTDIVVVGSTNMDLVATTTALPRPGETVLGRDFTTVGGGKGANQAMAAALAGADCAMIGAVGDDSFGAQLRRGLEGSGVDVGGMRDVPGPSGIALITVDDKGENSIVVAPGANATLSELTAPDRARIQGAKLLLCQLEVPLSIVEQAAWIARAAGARFVLNAAPAATLPTPLLEQVDLLVVNEVEAAMLADTDSTEPGDLLEALLAEVPAVVLTLGGAGSRLADRTGARVHIPAPQVPVVDTTAAGDAFTAALCTAWVRGSDLTQATRWATAAASLCVQRRGASAALPHRDEIDAWYREVYK